MQQSDSSSGTSEKKVSNNCKQNNKPYIKIRSVYSENLYQKGAEN